MSKHKFTLASLKEFEGGRLAKLFNAAVQKIADDCAARPHCGDARILSLTFAFKPLSDPADDAPLLAVVVEGEVKHKLPADAQRLRPYQMLARDDGTLAFNPDAPADPWTPTLPFDEEEGKE
jgi:hypothetical protein